MVYNLYWCIDKTCRCGWYILLVVNSKDIKENSKFHESFSLV